jgi:hypothetical protein
MMRRAVRAYLPCVENKNMQRGPKVFLGQRSVGLMTSSAGRIVRTPVTHAVHAVAALG